MKHSVSVTCCALLVSSISLSYAAEVPSGTVLAEKQELVRHIKDEPASLDPAKAVGLPEIQVIRDLFEGLVNQNEKGEIVPGVATQWKSNDNRIWTFTLRDNAKRADGRSARSSGIKYDDRSPPDDRKSIRDGRKASVAFYTRCYRRIYAGTFAV